MARVDGASFAALTPAEVEVVRLRCERGLTLMETAHVRTCSVQTVKNYTTSILRKTRQVGTNGVCYCWGYERGLTERVDGLRPGEV